MIEAILWISMIATGLGLVYYFSASHRQAEADRRDEEIDRLYRELWRPGATEDPAERQRLYAEIESLRRA